jgi:hypothetical protein
LASLIIGFSYLQRSGIPFGAVRAGNIIVEENGLIRIAHPLMVLEASNFQAYSSGNTRETLYLSPRELEALRSKHPLPTHNPFKSDVFTLGVVIIDLALLASQKDTYTDYQAISLSNLQRSLNELEAKYGKEFMSIIQLMTEPDE